VAAVLLVGSPAPAIELVNWRASPGPSTGNVTDQFTGVAIVNGRRVFSGIGKNFILLDTYTALYTAAGPPGSSPMVTTDLGLTEDQSVATAIAADTTGGFYATAAGVLLASQEARSYVYSSDDLGSPVQVLGPPPGLDPHVALVAINQDGISVGMQADSIPLAASPDGSSWRLTSVAGAELRAVDSTGTLFGGSSQPIPGWANTASIFDDLGTALFQDTVTGYVWDLEGDFAVGTRDGKAAYWRRVGGTYEAHFIEDEFGTPLEGELLAIDHVDGFIAGGYVGDSVPIVVVLHPDGNAWFDLESQLTVEPGTLSRVVGIDIDVGIRGIQIVFAAVEADRGYPGDPDRLRRCRGRRDRLGHHRQNARRSGTGPAPRPAPSGCRPPHASKAALRLGGAGRRRRGTYPPPPSGGNEASRRKILK